MKELEKSNETENKPKTSEDFLKWLGWTALSNRKLFKIEMFLLLVQYIWLLVLSILYFLKK